MFKIGDRVKAKGRVGTVRTLIDRGYDGPPQYGVLFDNDKKETKCEAADVREYVEKPSAPDSAGNPGPADK